MNQNIIGTDMERLAFSLFTRPQLDEDYKRTLLYLVYQTVKKNGMMQVDRLLFEVCRNYALNREDVRSAISALKGTFNALDVFVPRASADTKRVCRTNSTPEIQQWVLELETSRPYITRLLHKVH